jgi:hypothetical protein
MVRLPESQLRASAADADRVAKDLVLDTHVAF